MLGRVVVENGVKKIVPLTADCGSGNPVGTVIAVYSNKVPNGYLPCNGVAFDTAQFPVLYALLGDDHTPDLRECTLKGIGESGRTVGAHVKAGGLAVGEFIDDRIQEHSHSIRTSPVTSSGSSTGYTYASGDLATTGNATEARTGVTTEVKAVGVNWCIKATSGINENQADNVLSALSPVNVVALNNLHSVTSGAVYDELVSGGNWTYIKSGMGTSFMYKKIGNFVCLHIDTIDSALKFTANASNMKYSDDTDVVLPNSIIPTRHINVILIDNTHDSMFHARIFNTGVIRAWKNSDYEPQDIASWNADIIYRID